MAMKRFDDYCAKCDQYHDYRLDCTIPSVGMQPNQETIKALAENDANTNIYAKEIWNTAIEAAAVKLEQDYVFKPAAREVRRMKK
jgi:hypothetical protein